MGKNAEDFISELSASLRESGTMTTTDRVTAAGDLEITFHSTDPRACGGGTMLIPKAYLNE
ncbi:hypothetical protein GCM10010387_15670 [Streptomyces inusitatus]|uniref:Uncharacterized protein n=1 Tax=Streptomyces inusitatus TaxID=68221 RepID=A0A918PUP2_9ACTN|nr:hypothetical protein [Streptomyces inusitatus]GGZ23387.1 hypothetical protein GCM10010387_15670 [Streptomyces inusitatus]